MLPNEIFSLGLKPRDLTVLACLIRHKDNENDSCFPSRSLIAKECCIKEKTVDAALKALEERSLIIKKHRLRENGSHTSNKSESGLTIERKTGERLGVAKAPLPGHSGRQRRPQAVFEHSLCILTGWQPVSEIIKMVGSLSRICR